MEEGMLFLSPEWVHEAVRTVQAARSADKSFDEMTHDFSLTLQYMVTDLPQRLRDIHGGPQLAIMVQLHRGTVKSLQLGTEVSGDKKDFTVTTNYTAAKRMFSGEANPATAFIDREITVEPLRRVYQRPKFTAKAIVTANALLKIAKRVPTIFPQ